MYPFSLRRNPCTHYTCRESLDQVRDLGFHVMVTANSKGLLWTQHGAGLAATLGSEVVAVDRMDDDEVGRSYFSRRRELK